LGHGVESSKEERDLGVWITDNLNWSLRCSKAVSKAMKALGMIRRTFGSLSREGFQILYGTYVRPHLEYYAQVWTPYYKKDISCLEKVQQRATKLVRNLKNLPYYDGLKQLNLYSLEHQRLHGTSWLRLVVTVQLYGPLLYKKGDNYHYNTPVTCSCGLVSNAFMHCYLVNNSH